MEYITIHDWLPLKKETREKLQQIFFIPKTGMTEVETDQFGKAHVMKDGFTPVDLQVITVEKLVDYLGTAAINETIKDLWKRAVEKVEMLTIPEEEFNKFLKEAERVADQPFIETQEEIKEKFLKIYNQVKPLVEKDIELRKEIKEMNTADKQTKCDQCHFVTGSVRGMKVHKAKHNRTKV